MKNGAWRVIPMVIIPLAIWFITPPEGLTVSAWRLFGFYLSAIVGLILKPFSEALVLLSTVGAAGLFLNNVSIILAGYASTTVWLVFSAFGFGVAFIKTGLGRRIAYSMTRSFGNTTLRLGYVTALLDLVISPITPSNTARSGGIVFPIILSVVKTIGSEPGATAKKAGSYLMLNIYFVMKVTSFMFATAMAPNLLMIEFSKKILGVQLDWGLWAVAMLVPGLVLLVLVPLIGYYMDKPELTKIDNKKLVEEGLRDLGPMQKKEKILVGIFIFALLGWALPSVFGLFGIKLVINETAVAIVSMSLCFLLGVIGWDEFLDNKGAWNTLIWFGGIIGLASALDKAKFFPWLADVIKDNINFGNNPFLALVIIGFFSIVIRYFFASASSYAVAMLPVLLTVGKVAGIEPMSLALVLAGTNSYGGSLTHYGGGAAPIIFGAGYNTVKTWWIVGAVIAIVCFVVTMTIGYGWWKLLGII
ncbi:MULTISPECIES: DASS family sodium-coupled anion symporter [Pelosinus]|jgi:DASS family divalent anion:Na+ symporter|uniref:Anion transporter n=1 Tax=Pelosinus fermentans B4 TaxID=1149862 RepID=I8RH40_9FIRM|nr:MULTISPECIES: DASS family sodium-coupled anion symporter [Pelosinus]MDF2571134.1 hypothetical protein [Sporomusa sp.]EIW19008.1 anion transporter [Pelosinus fermentans B4]EIW21782.1 anion transporter [Pelosinus fermentans A11]OAM95369.1 anion transporter [Pelosinus fermentans DSM 17108]SDR27116.1 divalent anion:Na+ symporter, DASS family [Pelosinus fermentans]